MALAIAGKIVAIDLFDKPSTLKKMWDRLAEGHCSRHSRRPATRRTASSRSSVELYMGMARNMRWQQVETVGLGKSYRAVGDDGSLATALVAEGTLVHLGMSLPS